MRKKRSGFDTAVVLLLAAIALLYAWLYGDFAQDDAFITYRYARNIVAGRGFVYNPGEAVLGTTTPLYTFALALLGALTRLDIALVSHWLSVLSLWLSGVVLYGLGRDHEPRSAAAIAALTISNPLLISSKGMETAFLLLLLLLTLRLYVNRQLTLAGIALGLLMLTRYETILLAGVLGAHDFIRHKRLPLWLLVAGAVFLPWTMFAWRAFGQVIPQSATAKLIADRIPFLTGALVWWRTYTDQSLVYIAYLPLALLGGWIVLRHKSDALAYRLLLAWSAVYLVAASLFAGSFPWYYAPLIPGLSILVVWGLEFFAGALSTLMQRLRALGRTARAGSLAVAIAAAGLCAIQVQSWTEGWVSAEGRIVDARYVAYRDVAEWLNRHSGDGDSLAAAEIGVLGYYTDLRIVDLYGLVTSGLTPWLDDGLLETTRHALSLYAPDFVLIKNDDVLVALLQASAPYALMQQFAGNRYLLYARRSPSR